MSRVHWIELRPRDPASAGLVTLRFAGGARERSYYREDNGQHYKAGLVAAPRFAARVGFARDGFTGQTVPQASRIQIAPAESDVFESLTGYFWKDAEITIDAGPEDASTFPRLFTGTVVGDSIADGVFSLTIADLSTRLDKPVCTTRFAGNGGIEGGEEAEGRTKRRSWGFVFNVEGRLLDPANSIYEFGDPAFPLSSFSALRDKGRGGPFTVVAWQGSIAATFAALQASTPAQGGGVVAPSIACAKWWTEPSGPLTADFAGTPGTGGATAAAALIDAISASFSGPAVTDRAAAIALRPAAAGIHVGDESTTAAQLIDRLALGSSLIWVAAPEGVIKLLAWTFNHGDADVLQGQFIGRERAYAPHYRRRIGFQANNRRHSESEIAESVQASTITFDDGGTIPADKVFYIGGPEPVSVEEFREIATSAINTNTLTTAEEAIRSSLFRIETDEIIKDAATGLTIRELHDQLSLTVGGNTAYINFLRSIDSEGNGKIVLSINSDGAITGIFNTLTQGSGALKFVADQFSFVDPDGGNEVTPLSYGLDNILYLDTVRIKKLAVDAVETDNILLNNVTDSREWEADFAGADGDTLGASSLSTWAAFGNTGAKAICTFTSLPSGALVTVTMDFNAQRTGGDNDRVEFRLKRVAPGGTTTYHPTIFKAGMANYPANLHWQWRDSISVTGAYEYHIEYRRVTDRGSYFACAMLASVGKR